MSTLSPKVLKLSLKGCSLKERMAFVKEIEMEKTHPDYKHIMGWLSKENEYEAFKKRELRLSKRIYSYKDNF